jgi:transcriptional regulator with XRE-family HTH domain
MTSRTPQTFGQRLRLARRLAGYESQQELAEALGVSLKTVNRHETGEKPGRQAIERYLQKLGCTELWLVHGVGAGPDGARSPTNVEHYLADPPFGTPVDAEIQTRLRELDWQTVGAPDPTLEEVHDVRKMIEALVQKRR